MKPTLLKLLSVILIAGLAASLGFMKNKSFLPEGGGAVATPAAFSQFSSSQTPGGVLPQSPSPSGALYNQPLPTQAEIQEHINAILLAHGEQGIKIDGVIGEKSRIAWNRARVLQDGYFLTKEAME